MVTTITGVLNVWNNMGVFSYVIPFLLIFAVVFAILKKTGILGDDNDGILAIIAVAIGLLSLQFDFVSKFFSVIFPRFGIGLSLFLILMILVGFFVPKRDVDKKGFAIIGWVIGLGVVFWSLNSWGEWSQFGFGGWFTNNFWAIIILIVVVGTIIGVTKGD